MRNMGIRLKASAVSINYIREDTQEDQGSDRRLEATDGSEIQHGTTIDTSAASSSLNYDLENFDMFGYLYNVIPTTTPLGGLMCTQGTDFYFQIVPIGDYTEQNQQNDSVGNSYFEIQFFTSNFSYIV